MRVALALICTVFCLRATAQPGGPAPEQPASEPPFVTPEQPASEQPIVAPEPSPERPVETPERPQRKPRLELLNEQELEIFHRGSYREGERLGGTFLAIFPGFGLGHALQGRWLERGWIFTLTQIAGLVTLAYGRNRAEDECAVGDRCTSTGVKIYVGGSIAFVGAWIIGALDAYIVPTRHNSRLRAIHRKAYHSQLTPYVVPSADGDGTVGGISLQF